jgi:hypothetical protein
MRPAIWLGVVAAATAMTGISLWGCGSSNNPGPTDAGTDSSVTDANTTDGGDAGSDGRVTDAPCALDVDLLAPVDALANPVTASCQACIVDSGPCLQAIETCNGDCVCKEAVTAVATCIADSGNAGICTIDVLGNSMFAAAPEFQTLVGCQAVTCAAACNPPKPPADAGPDAADAQADAADASDAGPDAADAQADAADAGSTPDAADGSTADAGDASSPGDAGDAAPADAADGGG